MLTHAVRWAVPFRGWIARFRFVNWILLRLLGAHREGSVTTIRFGESRGLRWRRSKLHIPDGVEYWLGTYEMPVQRVLADRLSPGDTFFDVGANAGFFSVLAARKVGAAGLCVAVEPDPAFADISAGQAALNGFDNVTVVRRLVTAAPEQVWPWRIGDVATPTTTIDQLTREFRPPTLIKIDVEGLELEVLRGAEATLREHRPSLVIEAHSAELVMAVTTRLTAAYRCETFVTPYTTFNTSTLVAHPC